MGYYPTRYDKEGFIKFLEKNNVKDNIINKFKKLPIFIDYKNKKYELYINSTWYSIGDTFYNFELNYYCEENIEFLFSYKIFENIELSIDNLLCELSGINLIQNHECS